MSRLIIVSNRVAPISEGGPAAGGLAVGVYDALKETGGMWFGWSGDVLTSGQPQIKVEERGPVTFATIALMRRDYEAAVISSGFIGLFSQMSTPATICAAISIS